MKTLEQLSTEMVDVVNGFLDANRPFTEEGAAMLAAVLLAAATDFSRKTMGDDKTFHAMIATAASVKGLPAPTHVQFVPMPKGVKSGRPH